MRALWLLLALTPALVAAHPFDGFPAQAVEQLPSAERQRLTLDAGDILLTIDGRRRSLAVDRVVDNASGSHTIAGGIAGGGRFLITQGKGHALGLIALDGRRLRLFASPEGAWLADETASGLQGGGLADDVVTRDPAALARAPRAAASSAATRIVDVMFLYTPLLRQRYGAAALDLLWDQEVALANVAFANSGLDIALRRVDDREVAYPEDRDNFQLIDELWLASIAGASGYHSSLNFLAAARQTVGADIVSMWRTHDLNTRGSCGIAHLGGFDGVIDPRDGVQANMDGAHGGSLCDAFVFVHETGHNLGAGHNNGSGTDAWSHAFGKTGRYTTMMWSAGTGDPDRFLTVSYFSNPGITCGAAPCGIAAGLAGESDNADTMDRIADDVEGYVAATSLILVASAAADPGDSDGDGVDDDADAFPFDATEDTDSDGDGVGDVADEFPADPTESVDTDGDLTGDSADTDDDDDGTLDGSDAFPLDATEIADSDGDGVGDVADRFDSLRYEYADTDSDGTGDRSDSDDDGDGTPDFATANSNADVEVIVATEGDDTIRRFLGSTGAARGTLATMPAGSLHYRSDLVIGYGGDLYFVASSSVFRLDRIAGGAPEEVIRFHPATHGSAFPIGILATRDDLYIGEQGSAVLYRYDPFTRQLKGQVGGRDLRQGAIHNGNLYLISWIDRAVWRYSGTLAPMAQVVASGAGGMSDPADLTVGPDGHLYVASAGTDEVLEFDRNGGTLLDRFVTAGSGELDEPRCLAFLPDGQLLVCSRGTGEVLRYAANGAFLDVFLDAGDLGGGLPVGMLVTSRTLAPGESSSTPPLGGGGGGGGGSGGGSGGGGPALALVALLALLRLMQVSAPRAGRHTLD